MQTKRADDLEIEMGGVILYGRRPPEGFGFGISEDGIEGLDDGVASRAETVTRENDHGDYDVPDRLDSRIVPISGTCLAKSISDLDAFGDALKGVFAETSQTVTVRHLGRVRWGTARLSPGTKVKFAPVGRTMLTKIPKATFGLQLKFADPRLYGTDRRFPKAGYASSVFAAHLGNFTALPVITVAGSSANGYTMRGPDGRSYRVTRALQANLPHVIDMAEGYLRINGELMIPQGVAFPQRWGVPYGEGITMTIEPAAGGTASFFVDLEDTWN